MAGLPQGRASASSPAPTWDPTHDKYGALPFICGTAVSSTIALVFAVPLSIGIALFTNELAPRRLRKPVIYLVDLLAAIPSVVYGLWALAVLTTPANKLYKHIADTVGKLPMLGRVFGGPTSGVELHDRRHRARGDDDPDRHRDQPRGARHRFAGREERRARDGRDPVGDAARDACSRVRAAGSSAR